MATTITPIRLIGIVRASAVSGSSHPDPSRGRPTSSSVSWFSNSKADYMVDGDAKSTEPASVVDDAKNQASRFPGRLTTEKARRLRILTSETSSFHDVMYHSAIASRLASDFSGFVVSSD